MLLTQACQESDAWLGSFPNSLHLDGDHVFVVDSSNNEVDRLDLKSREYTDGYIDLPLDSNPVHVQSDSKFIYVLTAPFTAGLSPRLVSYSKRDQEVKSELATSPLLDRPYGLSKDSDGCLLVANTAYTYGSPVGDGSILVKCPDRDAVKFNVGCKNPTRVLSHEGDLFVFCSGVDEFDKDWVYKSTTGSGICKYDKDLKLVGSCVALGEDVGTPAMDVGTPAMEGFILVGSSHTASYALYDYDLNLLSKVKSMAESDGMLIPTLVSGGKFILASSNTDELIPISVIGGKVVEHKAFKFPEGVEKRLVMDLVYSSELDYLVLLNSNWATVEVYTGVNSLFELSSESSLDLVYSFSP